LLLVSLLLFVMQVLIPGKIFMLDDIQTGRLAVTLCTVWSLPLYWVTWKFLFRDRPALSQNRHNNLIVAGFAKLHSTFKSIGSDLPAIKWFLASVAFSESANQGGNTIATTYFSTYLLMDSQTIGLVIVVILFGDIAGTLIGNAASLRYNPVISAQLCLVLYVLVTFAMCLHLHPSNANLAFVYGFFWGICKGWIHPAHNTIFCTIIPRGNEVEMMGLYFFACQIFAFLPPMVFSILNEAGLSMDIGMGSLGVYFIVGALGLNRMGDYQEALNAVNGLGSDHEDRQPSISEISKEEPADENGIDVRVTIPMANSGNLFASVGQELS
jgi:MFS-type transporter involved in bile tolerance (Atg22 family)